MTSETPNLHVSKNQNIFKTKQDIEKLKTPLRFVWKCCSDAQGHFKSKYILVSCACVHFSLSSVEVSRIPRNSYKFSVILRGKLSRETLPRNGRNSARLVEIMPKRA